MFLTRRLTIEEIQMDFGLSNYSKTQRQTFTLNSFVGATTGSPHFREWERVEDIKILGREGGLVAWPLRMTQVLDVGNISHRVTNKCLIY